MASIILFVVVVAFAWNLGVHYTGAVMGMPHASRAIAVWPALVLIGIFTIIGATFASGGVQETVGLHIIDAGRVTVPDATAIVLAAGILTMIYNYYKVPTSTIQILVFCVVGVGLAGGIPVAWRTIGRLAVLWVCAPVVACGLGFLFTRLLDLAIPPAAARAQVSEQVAPLVLAGGSGSAATVAERAGATGVGARWFPAVAEPLRDDVRDRALAMRRLPASLTLAALRWLPGLLVLVGVAASFVLGANDVANATGALVMTHQFSTTVAGLIGGVAMAVGGLTWGRRILRTVAFDVVHMDLSMASAAQGVQALVVIAAVTQGLFTSMNQALIGAMAGAGLARGQQTVQWKQIKGILRGWLIGPLSGLTLAAALELIVRLLTR
ncbi:MAG: inorganic phosphate transporter [Thermomicrobiales bacterium]